MLRLARARPRSSCRSGCSTSAGSRPRRARSRQLNVLEAVTLREDAPRSCSRSSRRASRPARTSSTSCRSACARPREGWRRARDRGGRRLDRLRRARRRRAGARAAAPHPRLGRGRRRARRRCASAGPRARAPGYGGTRRRAAGRRRAVQLVGRVRRRADPQGVPPRSSRASTRSSSCCASSPQREFPHIAPLAGWYEYAGRLIDATLGTLQEYLSGARDGWELCLDDLEGVRPARCARPRRGDRRAAHARWARSAATRTSRPRSRAPRTSSLLTATVDEEIERMFVDLDADDPALGADRRPRPGRARAAPGALAHRHRRAPDPHARRLPPRPDHADRAAAG